MTGGHSSGIAPRALLVRLWRLLLWHVLVSALFVFGASIVLGLPPWALGVREIGWLGLMYLAYALSTMAPSLAYLHRQSLPMISVMLVTAGVFAAFRVLSPAADAGWAEVWPYIVGQRDRRLLEWPIPPGLVIVSFGLAVICNTALSRFGTARRALVLAAGLTATIALLSLPGIRGSWLYAALEDAVVHETNASLHRLRISYFRERFPAPAASGGALAVWGRDLLLMTGVGEFYRLSLSDDGRRLETLALAFRAPMNREAFLNEYPDLNPFRRSVFRASDLVVVASPGSTDLLLLASHLHYDPERSCYTVRVSELTVPSGDLQSVRRTDPWRTAYEARPCLPLTPNGAFYFAAHQTGGALLPRGGSQILLALGDGGFDGIQVEQSVPRDPNSDYGKIIEWDRVSGDSRILTSGHRSPGGLLQDVAGQLWLVEHGPRGGDELNRIRSGRDYGWPVSTLGAQYGRFSWTPPPGHSLSAPVELPEFAWTPSIAPSDLIRLEGEPFTRWHGDFLVSALGDRAIYRVGIADGDPIQSERIPLYERVRSLVQDHRGRIVFWTDRAVIGVVDVADPR